MKKLLLVLLLFVSLLGYGQKFTKVNGAIVKDTAKTKTVKTDKVYQKIDGVTFYQGAKGGIYYWKTSKKTGKKYKSYLK
jgi:hypothetical protein